MQRGKGWDLSLYTPVSWLVEEGLVANLTEVGKGWGRRRDLIRK
jgi:hypothetical protein